MPVAASIAAGIIPMLTYLFIIWKMDKYEPEPIKLIAASYLWGAVAAIILSIAGSFVFIMFLEITGVQESTALHSIIVAPLVEETAKALFLFVIITKKDFDNITDGLVYGAAIGLGFGMTENIFYYLTYGTTLDYWLFLVFVRSGFSAVMHAVATAIVGAFFGMAKYAYYRHRFILPIFGLAIASFIHFMWNYSVTFENTFYWGFAFLIFATAGFLVSFKLSLKSEQNILKKELKGEIPDEHIKIIISKLRNDEGWVDEDVRKNYISTAVKLAFRKCQSKQRKKDLGKLFELEIEELRKYLNFVNITKEKK